MSKNLDITLLLDFYGDLLTEKQRTFISYYYNDDLSLAEIAANEGITRQAVRDIIRRAVRQLSEAERQLGFAARMESINAAVSLIRETAGRLPDCEAANSIEEHSVFFLEGEHS